MAPLQHLARRAQVTTNRWLGIVIVVILGLAALFLIVVTCIIVRRKSARRHRERKMIAEQETRALVAQDPDTTNSHQFVRQPYNPHEYRIANSGPPDSYSYAGNESPIELQGGTIHGPRTTPQQLDNYGAPATATYDGRPVEMPAPAAAR